MRLCCFVLKTALEIYRFSENKIQDCDRCIERQLATFEIRAPLPNPRQNLRTQWGCRSSPGDAGNWPSLKLLRHTTDAQDNS